MRRTGRLYQSLGLAASSLLLPLLLGGAGCPEIGRDDTTMSSPPDASSASSELASTATGPFELGLEPLTVALAVPAAGRERLAALARGSRPGGLRLAVEGVELLRPGGVYQVYLELPASEEPAASHPAFAGHLSPYGDAGSGAESRRGFDVTERARALWRDGGPAGPVRVTFVPARPPEASEAGPGPFLRIRRVALVERPLSPSR